MKTLTPQTDEILTLPELMAYLDGHLDVRDEASILAAAPKLLALARNRRFLAEFLVESMRNPARFQDGNMYTGPVLVLAGGDGYVVRAVGWPAAHEEMRTPSNFGVHAYDGDAQVAHTHNFSLLTALHAGSGYETDVYEWSPSGDDDPRPGDRVTLRPQGRHRLGPGVVMFYRAFEDAHVQYPPSTYSVSVNLLVHPRDEDTRDQHFFDVTNSTLVLSGGRGNDKRARLLELAGAIGDPSFAPHLAAIAGSHTASRVREAAAAALERVTLR